MDFCPPPLTLVERNAACVERAETCGVIQMVNSPHADTGEISAFQEGASANQIQRPELAYVYKTYT